MFFADGEGEAHVQHQQARLVCYNCPVQVQCLEECVIHDMRSGVWGGLTESQRKRYLRPALLEEGLSDEVLERVIVSCGVQLLKRHKVTPGSSPLP